MAFWVLFTAIEFLVSVAVILKNSGYAVIKGNLETLIFFVKPTLILLFHFSRSFYQISKNQQLLLMMNFHLIKSNTERYKLKYLLFCQLIQIIFFSLCMFCFSLQMEILMERTISETPVESELTSSDID